MISDASLREIASKTDWLTFAKALRIAMRNCSGYGFENPDDLLREVARLRGVQVASLRNPLAAERWYAAHFPETDVTEVSPVSMVSLLLFAQIWRIDSGLARRMQPRFISGQINRDELKAALEAAKQESGGRGLAAHERFWQAERFVRSVHSYLQKNIEVLGFGANARIEDAGSSGDGGADLLVMVGSQVVMAIQIKQSRQKLHRRYLMDVLGRLGLSARQFPAMLLIVAGSWRDSMDELVALRADAHMMNVNFALFEDDEHGAGALTMVEPEWPLRKEPLTAIELATSARARRLGFNLSQQDLAERSGVPLSAIRRFETSGEVTLASLLAICDVLEVTDRLHSLFPPAPPRTLDELDGPKSRTSRKRPSPRRKV
ncbi:helix-turn-helix domain-containing protein [Paracoccus ravus]|uniref:helix-turn-helix domain-containing protein n=1 Tax=Paracoccus ravus TaxID=2447760 RepID=UPI001FD702C2|nr:helix-turn-helix transcriptional regulator [Paracoccus ravus]